LSEKVKKPESQTDNFRCASILLLLLPSLHMLVLPPR